jgi:hypothetical protein
VQGSSSVFAISHASAVSYLIRNFQQVFRALPNSIISFVNTAHGKSCNSYLYRGLPRMGHVCRRNHFGSRMSPVITQKCGAVRQKRMGIN